MPPLNAFNDVADVNILTRDLINNNRRKSSVSFHEDIRVEFLPTRHDWSEEEKNSRWISNAEYLGFQLDVSNTLFLLRNQPPESINEMTISSRGVECRDPSITYRRRTIRKEAKQIVFARQRIQNKQMNDNQHHHYQDEGYLIACLSILAQNAMQQALNFAAQDELDARNFQNVVHSQPNSDVDDLLFGYDEIRPQSFISSGTNTAAAATSDDTTEFDNSWLQEYV